MQSSVFISLCISKTTSRIPHCFHITWANCLIYLAPCSSAVLYKQSIGAHVSINKKLLLLNLLRRRPIRPLICHLLILHLLIYWEAFNISLQNILVAFQICAFSWNSLRARSTQLFNFFLVKHAHHLPNIPSSHIFDNVFSFATTTMIVEPCFHLLLRASA